MLNDFIRQIGERGIVDFAENPNAPGALVRLANDLVGWPMCNGNPANGYIQDANSTEIAGDLPAVHHFCYECGHPMDSALNHYGSDTDDAEWLCAACHDQPPNTWANTGRPPPKSN